MIALRLTLTLTLALCVPLPAVAQSSEALSLLSTPQDIPMITHTAIGRSSVILPADVFEIEISDSGGITDVFIRLSPAATARFADWTTLADGFPMNIALCGMTVLEQDEVTPVTTGTLYIPNLNAVQAEALRAVWQGRATCSTLSPEVFPIGQ